MTGQEDTDNLPQHPLQNNLELDVEGKIVDLFRLLQQLSKAKRQRCLALIQACTDQYMTIEEDEDDGSAHNMASKTELHSGGLPTNIDMVKQEIHEHDEQQNDGYATTMAPADSNSSETSKDLYHNYVSKMNIEEDSTYKSHSTTEVTPANKTFASSESPSPEQTYVTQVHPEPTKSEEMDVLTKGRTRGRPPKRLTASPPLVDGGCHESDTSQYGLEPGRTTEHTEQNNWNWADSPEAVGRVHDVNAVGVEVNNKDCYDYLVEHNADGDTDSNHDYDHDDSWVDEHEEGEHKKELSTERAASDAHLSEKKELLSATGGVKRKRGRPRKNFKDIATADKLEPVNVKSRKSKPKKKWQCDVCEKMLSTQLALTYHMRIHTGEEPYACEICGKTFKHPGVRNIHMKKDHLGETPHDCKECDFKCFYKHDLVKHVRKVHTKERPFLCDTCGKSFITKKHLNRHEEVHKTQVLRCTLCDHTTHSSACLSFHMRNMHCERPLYICEICGAQLRYLHTYQQHLARHSGLRPHSCDQCEAAFATMSELTKHIKTHWGDRKQVCDTCGKKFMTREHLRCHTRVHTGVKPYACPDCSYTCSIKTNLRKHCIAIHKRVYPPLREKLFNFSKNKELKESNTEPDGAGEHKMEEEPVLE